MIAGKQRIGSILARIDGSVVNALLVLTAVVVTISCFRPISSPDFWWQLAEGKQMLARLRFNEEPLGGFGLPSTPFLNEYGVYEILIALGHSAGGMIGLRLFFGLINILPFVLVAGIWLLRQRGFRFVYWFAIAMATGLLFVRLRQRPETLGNALFVGLGVIVLQRGLRTRLSPIHYALVASILCLWANVHSSFIVGLGMLGLWTLEMTCRNQQRSTAMSAAGAITVGLAAVVLNPAGLYRLADPFSLQTNFWSSAITTEMWPLPLHLYWLMGLIAGYGSYLWFSSPSGERPVWLLLMFFGTIVLALISWRHVSLLGCMMLLILAFRLQYDVEPFGMQRRNLGVVGRRFLSLGLVAVLSAVLFFLVREEYPQWKRGEWTVYTQQYAPEALDELHRREPQGAAFLADIMVSAYAQGKPEYRLQPLLDTGLSRFDNSTAQFFFYLQNQPAALRMALNSLDTQYVIVNEYNAHWAAVLNRMSDWLIVFTTPNGILYRRSTDVYDPIALQESVRAIGEFLQLQRKTTAASYYGMGLLSPAETLDLLAKAEVDWWKEPRINFLLDWLNEVPPTTRHKALARLSTKNPSELRLRLLLALSLGSHNEARSLSQSALLSANELEDVALRAEVSLSTGQPCAAWNSLKGIFPPRPWSVRLAELVDKIRRACPVPRNESPRMRIHELAWSNELQAWMQEMSRKLNQRILVNRKPASA